MKRGFSVALVASLSACAPLQQAPLVYTSGQTVGIRVGVSPTQADTAEIVIGVKLLDAAYAPVAVARPELDGKIEILEKVDGQTVRDLFAIREIYGQFGEELTPESVKNLNEKEIEELKMFLDKSSSKDAAQKRFNEAEKNKKRDLENKNGAETKLKAINDLVDFWDKNKDRLLGNCKDEDKLKVANVVSALSVTCAKDELNKTQVYQDYLKSGADVAKRGEIETQKNDAIASLTTAITGTEAGVNSARQELQEAQNELESARKKGLEALQKLANVRKRDALSAYGAFNQDSAGNATDKGDVNLKLGKVFSTGVAAQNLTEAAKISATMSSLGQCVESGLKGLQGDKTEAMVKSIIDACGVAAEKMFKKNNS